MDCSDVDKSTVWAAPLDGLLRLVLLVAGCAVECLKRQL